MCLFSMNWLTRPKQQIAKALVEGPWENSTIAPETPWVKKIVAPKPPEMDLLHNREGTLLVRFKRSESNAVFQYVINEKLDGEWQKPVVISGKYGSYPIKENVNAIAVRIADRSRQMSGFSIVNIEPLELVE